ncbi:hypothetical protein ACJ2A9_16355 [Anaerobacillus sp. MEB173]|uniref:hypothetical protein n=1 Tax=Anaerobacillus sp. MEB173 TaxID=3383345 RepID=UPI003F91DD21
MAKKICWAIIFLTVIVNVFMLHLSVQHYYGHEYEAIAPLSIVGMISAVIALITYFYWRKLEY